MRWPWPRAVSPLPAMAEPPAHFPPEFVATFREIAGQLGHRATLDRAIEIEAATMLLEAMRVNTPDWPAERFCALAEIMRGLRSTT